MRLSGREFGEEEIFLIKRLLTENPDITRRGLSRRVCEEFKWQSLNGRSKEVSCRKALLELDRLGLIRLPAAREGLFQGTAEKAGVETAFI